MNWRHPATFIPAIVVMVGMFVVSDEPRPSQSITIEVGPLLYHLTAFGFLAALIVLPLLGAGYKPIVAIAAGLLTSAGYGVFDEYHQSFVPYRSVSELDVALDTIAAFMGALVTCTIFWLGENKSVKRIREVDN